MDPQSSPLRPESGGRLLDVMHDQLRTLRYSYRTEQQYLHWVRRFVLFHQKRHPRDLGAADVESFLTHLAVDRRASASTQNQALSALLFLYQKVLEIELPWLDNIVRAKRSRHVPVVVTHTEVRAVIAQLEDEYWLVATLLYGAGLRLQEALQLRTRSGTALRRTCSSAATTYARCRNCSATVT